MHIALGRIISQNPVDDNADFPIIEPAIGSEPSLGLHCRGRHQEERCKANDQCDETLDQEQPSPSRKSGDTIEMQKTISHEGVDDHGDTECCPEEAEAYR